MFRGTFDFEAAPFDWGQGYRKPEIPLQDLVVAERPVRLFTGGRGWRGIVLLVAGLARCFPAWVGGLWPPTARLVLACCAPHVRQTSCLPACTALPASPACSQRIQRAACGPAGHVCGPGCQGGPSEGAGHQCRQASYTAPDCVLRCSLLWCCAPAVPDNSSRHARAPGHTATSECCCVCVCS